MIIGLVAFAVLALAGGTRFGATVRSVMAPNCSLQARLMSESGIRYATARLRSCASASDVTAAVAAMNGHTYTVDSVKGLSFNIQASYDNSTNIASVTSTGIGCNDLGFVPTSSTSTAPSINLPQISSGGGGGTASDNPALQGINSGGTFNDASSRTIGNVSASSGSIGFGSVVTGSVNYTGTSTCLEIDGTVGTAGKGTYVCSNACVYVRYSGVVYGDIYAQGDVDIEGQVVGNVYSGGTVTLTSNGVVTGSVFALAGVDQTSGGRVRGSIHSTGPVTTGYNAIINGDIYATGAVTVSGTVSGSIYSAGKISMTSHGSCQNAYSAGNITLSDFASTITQNAYASGNINIGAQCTVAGSAYSGGNITISGWAALLRGNAYVRGTVSTSSGGACNGTITRGYSYSYTFQDPSPPSRPTACSSYTLPGHVSVAPTMDCNIYGDAIFIGSTLSDKSKACPDFRAHWGSRICFDLSSPNTYINIFVKNDLNIESNVGVYVRTSAANSCFSSGNRVNNTSFANSAAASRVYMDVLGTADFGFAGTWFGTVYSKGKLTTGGASSYIGAFYTNGIYSAGYNSVLLFVPAEYVKQNWP